MLCVYAPDCTDFSGNGLGTISPSSALVKETLNGEYELEVVHPLDDVGKWHRLVEGNIIRAPVPAGVTPQVALSYKEYSEGKAIYRINTRRNPLVLRSSTGSKYKKLGKYKKGKLVIVLEQTTDTLWEVVCPDGKRGYMPAASLAFVRNTSDYADAAGVIESRQLRDQPFRIYRVVPELDKVTAYARHVFYDLSENMVKKLEVLETTTGKTVVDQLSAACLSEHDFTFYSDLSTTAEEVSYENKNPVDILLGDEGTSPNSNLYGGGALCVAKVGPHVFIRGSVMAKSGALLTTLPSGYYPTDGNRYKLAACGGSRVARLYVNGAGQLHLEWVRNMSDGNAYTTAVWVDCNFDYWID